LIEFNKGQSDLYNRLTEFKRNKEPYFVVKGFAGTGKTTVVREFVKNELTNYCFSAPTHRALNVIKKYGGTGKTLHSLHGLRPNLNLDNFRADNVLFDTISPCKFENYKWIVPDEASMINTDMLKLTIERGIEFGTKLIFVGDPLQLYPVKENATPVFKLPSSRIFELNEIVRQEHDNPVTKLISIIRDDIINNTFHFLKYLVQNPSNIIDDNGIHKGYTVMRKNDFVSLMVNRYRDIHPIIDNNLIRCLNYTNYSVFFYNNIVRQNTNSNFKDFLNTEDCITAYTTVTMDGDFVPIINNSSDYKIKTCSDEIDNLGIKLKLINVEAFENEETADYPLSIVDHTDLSSFDTYYKVIRDLYTRAIQPNNPNKSVDWKKYYVFRNHHLCMVDIVLYINGQKYTITKDLDYSYAMTVHKSQGGTFKDVMIDLGDILYYKFNNTRSMYKDIDTIKRLIYVAISRCNNTATFII